MPTMTTQHKEIVYAGASVEQGQSLLRLYDHNDGSWYIAVIDADGSWYSLNILADTPMAECYGSA